MIGGLDESEAGGGGQRDQLVRGDLAFSCPRHALIWAVDYSLAGGGFADHCGGGGDERLDPRHAHKIDRIRVRDECPVGLNVPSC